MEIELLQELIEISKDIKNLLLAVLVILIGIIAMKAIDKLTDGK
jgi:hypothetical protein